MPLRQYQQDALQALHAALRRGQHPVASLPTGSGKSLILAALAAQQPGRVLIVTHRKELLQQNAGQLLRMDQEAEIGLYSAGLGRRETEARVLFAGVQSIYRKMVELQASGPFGLVIVDEAHLVAPQNESIMYDAVLTACPTAQRVGLSATPYRLDDGPIWQGENAWFDTLAYQIGIRDLTPEYLAPLRGLLTAHGIDVAGVRKRQGEFVTGDLSQVACNEALVKGAIGELCQVGATRQAWLLFSVDVAHTEMVTKALGDRGVQAAMLVGKTPADERARVLEDFREGRLRALVNCEVATTGFDIPRIDLIDMLRPTLSKSLCVQMLGRGCRQAPGKEDCLILDHAENLWRHRPLDGVPPLEATPERQAKRKIATRHVWEPHPLKHTMEASLEEPWGEGEAVAIPVETIAYKLEPSKKYPGKTNLVVLYKVMHPLKWVRQYVCLEYPHGAAWHAAQWFKRRGLAMPATAAQARDLLAQQGRRCMPAAVVVRYEGKYPRIHVEHFRD